MMSKNTEKLFCTIDHANKLREGQRDFNPYRYWLTQEKHRETVAARTGCRENLPRTAKEKQQLT